MVTPEHIKDKGLPSNTFRYKIPSNQTKRDRCAKVVPLDFMKVHEGSSGRAHAHMKSAECTFAFWS